MSNSNVKHHLETHSETTEAEMLFNDAWKTLEEELGLNELQFPKEIFWLNGAPGAGKGTHTRFIIQHQGLKDNAFFAISDILQSPEAKRLKDAGVLVGDKEVLGLLLKKLLDPNFESGVIVDGFPRTMVQAECLKLFFNKLHSLVAEGKMTQEPQFHIVVLYVDEPESIKRQLHRGSVAQAHNEKVQETGEGSLAEVRKTDLSADAAKDRFQTFKAQTYDPLQTLSGTFPYHFIDAHGTIESIRETITRELSSSKRT